MSGALLAAQGCMRNHYPDTSASVQSTGSGVRTAGFRLKSNGTFASLVQAAETELGRWVQLLHGSLAGYDAIATLSSGSVTGTFGSRLNLGTTREWSNSDAVVDGTPTLGTFTIEIYETGSGPKVAGPWTINLEAERV